MKKSEILRGAQAHLVYNAVVVDGFIHSCSAISDFLLCNRDPGVPPTMQLVWASPVWEVVQKAIMDCGYGSTWEILHMMNDLGLSFEEKQGARFMWLELLALECEDFGD